MLRYPATAIALTMAEVKDYEQRRQLGDHFITPVQQSRIQHGDSPAHPARPVLCASPVLIRGDDIRHHADAVSQVDPRTLLTDSSPQFVLAHRPRMPTRHDEPGDPEARVLQSSAGRFQRLGLATDILDQSDNVANISPMRLPPPFSMGMRVVSDKHTMPTVRPSVERSPGGVPDTAIPDTPSRISSLDGCDGPAASPPAKAGRPSETSGQSTGGGLASSSSSRTPWETLSETHQGHEEKSDVTSHKSALGFHIYSDTVPASFQPSTPQHLPEARHQSRFLGSYTAPAARAERRAGHETGISQRRDSRAPDRTGLETPGFRGLYGGSENADDLVLYQEALRSNAPEADRGT